MSEPTPGKPVIYTVGRTLKNRDRKGDATTAHAQIAAESYRCELDQLRIDNHLLHTVLERMTVERDEAISELEKHKARWARIEQIVESPGCVVRFTFRNYKELAGDKDFIYFSTNLLDDPKGRGNTAAEAFDNAIRG